MVVHLEPLTRKSMSREYPKRYMTNFPRSSTSTTSKSRSKHHHPLRLCFCRSLNALTSFLKSCSSHYLTCSAHSLVRLVCLHHWKSSLTASSTASSHPCGSIVHLRARRIWSTGLSTLSADTTSTRTGLRLRSQRSSG